LDSDLTYLVREEPHSCRKAGVCRGGKSGRGVYGRMKLTSVSAAHVAPKRLAHKKASVRQLLPLM
jgi:hypothetical protein